MQVVPGAARATGAGASPAQPHARVQPGVGDVDQRVDDDEQYRDDEHAGFNDRVVAGVHSAHQQAAEAGPREDALGDDRAADHVAGLQRDLGDHRDGGVAQRVAPDDDAFTEPFGAGGPDVGP